MPDDDPAPRTQLHTPPVAPATPAARTVAADAAPTDAAPNPDRTVARTPADPTSVGDPLNPMIAAFVPGYDIVREVNRGGMGVVYEARQHGLNRTVALKMVLGDGRADDRTVRRFLVEAAAVAAVVHPNVVQVHHCGEHLGRPFLALEFCPGGTLADRLQNQVPLPPRTSAELVVKIARGVAAAHAAGVVHRDLKPGNVLFDAAGNPKVADFGLAKLAAGADLTRAGDVMGTPAYMAPEQASGDIPSIGPATDVWALGVILHECLTAARPFAGGSAAEVMAAIQTRDPRSPRSLVPTLPADLEYVCLKCLRKPPRDRYPSAGEMAADLDRYLAGEPLGGRGRDWRYRARKAAARWWRPAAAAALLALVVGGVWWAATRPGPPPAEDPGVRLRREEVLQRIDSLTRSKPNPDRESPHPVEAVADLPAAGLAGLRMIYDDRVVDLRAWRQLPPGDPAAASFVVFHNRRVMLKTDPVNEYRIEYRTSGRDLLLRAVSPNPDKAKVLVADRPGFVGRQAMKVRQLVLDVAAVPVGSEFTVQTAATFRDSLQTPEDRWIGVMGYTGSLKASILLLFPADRPFLDYTLRVAPTSNAAPVEYAGPVITFKADDNRWVYWEIPSPEDGHVYRVDWTW